MLLTASIPGQAPAEIDASEKPRPLIVIHHARMLSVRYTRTSHLHYCEKIVGNTYIVHFPLLCWPQNISQS